MTGITVTVLCVCFPHVFVSVCLSVCLFLQFCILCWLLPLFNNKIIQLFFSEKYKRPRRETSIIRLITSKIYFFFYRYLVQKPGIYFNRDRLGLYVEIQINFLGQCHVCLFWFCSQNNMSSI